jgi:hypothetical protein
VELVVGPDVLAVCRLPAGSAWPEPPDDVRLYSATRTATELSVVCTPGQVPSGAEVESGWRALSVAGSLDFAMIGVIATLAGVLARAGVSVFVLSTFATDHLLVKEASLHQAVGALTSAGHTVTDAGT